LVEPLERRALLAAVSWDGGGDGVNFTDPLNWSNDALPTSADDVTVDVPGGTPALRLANGGVPMRSLVLREPLRIEIGGNLSVLTTAHSDLSVELEGGLILGGAWTFGFAGALVAGTVTSSRLQGVDSVTGDILLTTAGARLTVTGGLSVTGTIRMGGAGARLTFFGTQTLESGTVRFVSTQTSNFPELSVVAGALTLGDDVVVNAVTNGRGALRGDTYTNRGTIAMADSANLSINVPVAFLNEGQMTAVSGGLIHLLAMLEFRNEAGATLTAGPGGTVAIQGTDGGQANVNTRFWKNAGTIAVNDGVLYLGGTVKSAEIGTIQRSGGVVRLNGVLDNAGNTFAPPVGVGPWVLDNGRIVGGTVNLSLSDNTFNPANRFVGPIVFNGNLNLSNLTVESGVDLNGTAVIRDELILEGSQTIAGGTWRFQNPLSFPPPSHPALHIVGNATVTLGDDVTVDAGYVNLGLRANATGGGTLINEGLIELRPTVSANLRSRINPGNAFGNAGTLRVQDGADVTISPAGSGFLNEGLLQVGQTSNQRLLAIEGLFSNTGVLDVNSVAEISPTSAGLLASVADQTATGYNGGAWDGPGIRSSRAAASAAANDAVGYAVINFATPVLRVRYTRVGDADANGGVNLGDFNQLAANFGVTGNARWDQGDFNFDRNVNLADFNLLAANFGGVVSAPASRSEREQFGNGEDEERRDDGDGLLG
jgi:hypothetical protein